MYVWVITNDFLAKFFEDSHRGTIGPSYMCSMDYQQITKHPKRRYFRMKNDDGEVCYKGVFVPLTDDANEFSPMDDFGESNGCTMIEYLRNGEWTIN